MLAVKIGTFNPKATKKGQVNGGQIIANNIGNLSTVYMCSSPMIKLECAY